MSLRTVVSAALLGLCLSLSFAQAADPPTTASVQHSLDKIAERKLPEDEFFSDAFFLSKDMSGSKP